MKILFLISTVVFLFGCGKKAINIDPEWAKEWQYAYDASQTITIKPNGYAVYKTKRGSYRGFARIKEKVFSIGRGKFLLNKYPAYFGPPLNRWEMEIDNMQFLKYDN
jgi:hypothetical protein